MREGLEHLEVEMKKWTDGPKYLLSRFHSPLAVLRLADRLAGDGLAHVGSPSSLLRYIDDFPRSIGTFFVVAEAELVDAMKRARPDLDIRGFSLATSMLHD